MGCCVYWAQVCAAKHMRMLSYQRTIFLIFLKFTVGPFITFQSVADNARIILAIQFVCLATAPFLAKRWIIYGKWWIYGIFIGVKSNVETICLWFKRLGNHSAKMLQTSMGNSRTGENPMRDRKKEIWWKINQDVRELQLHIYRQYYYYY